MKKVSSSYVTGWDCRKIPDECFKCDKKAEFILRVWGFRGRKTIFLCKDCSKKWANGDLVI